MTTQDNITTRAQEFARNAHAHISQTSITGVEKPHILHIQEVADLVWASGGTDEEITAAWLHDTVEDTDVTLADIEKEFGKNVASMVDDLTDPLNFKGMPLPERKRLQAERLRNKSDSVKRIKIADQTSNVKHVAVDPAGDLPQENFVEYIQGAKLLADICKGVSPLLDNLFEQAYKRGMKKYVK